MKQELERLSSIANEKSAVLYQRKQNMDQLPQVIEDIEGSIRKASSLLFNEKLMSKQEIVAISEAPAKMQIALNKFQSEQLSTSDRKIVASVSVQELEEDYRPRQAGLVYPFMFTVDLNLESLVGKKIDKLFSLEGVDSSERPNLIFSLTVN